MILFFGLGARLRLGFRLDTKISMGRAPMQIANAKNARRARVRSLRQLDARKLPLPGFTDLPGDLATSLGLDGLGFRV